MIELDVRLPLARFELVVALATGADALAVLGPSGSGKTSLLDVVAGLRSATGRLVVDGEVLLDSARGVRVRPERRRIGYVPQDGLLFPHLDVAGNVRFAERPGAAGRRLVDEAVAMLELEPLLARWPATLSGGERQRVALARALATAPRLLLLDEPLAAVDVALRERILPYLLRVRDERRIPLWYVTHNAGEAAVLAREAVLLRDGRVAAHGPAASVLAAGAVVAVDPQATFENVLDGVLEHVDDASGTGRLALSAGTVLSVPAGPEAVAGVRAVYAVGPEELLLATHPLAGVSARNVFPGTVAGTETIGRDVLVRITAAGIDWQARLTPTAVRDLALAPGTAVWLAIKTHAFRRLR